MNVDISTLDTVVIFGLLLLSVASWLIPLVVFCIRWLVFAIGKKVYTRPTPVTKMIRLSLCLIGAVWFLRYAVGYFAAITPMADDIPLTKLEELFNSLVHALQTFSMDEDYTAYITGGKDMLRALIGKESVWPDVYGFYASVLNIIAPIVGGVAVFEIISGMFPKVRLFMSRFVWYREKYYFSELNDASLALAKSIFEINNKLFARPLFIFTDVYEANDENASERINSAKTMGAICVKNDIIHVFIGKGAKKKIFIIDDGSSTEKLTGLTHSPRAVRLRGAEIFVFTEDGTYIQVEKQVYEKFESVFANEQDIPNIVPVHSYKNLVSDLLVKIPLYEPLIHKKRNSDGSVDLTVSIFGLGHIGTEMFLAVYWFGQMLGCNLTVNVISAESEDVFWDKINYINPEIRATTEDGNPILAYNRKGGISPRYCKVNYISSDVQSSGFITDISSSDGNSSLWDTDYFFISLGADSKNISFANTICKYAAEKQICEYDPQNPTAKQKNMVITYVVYNSSVAEALNQNSVRRFTDGVSGIYMRAVGTLDEVFSQRNAFMPEYDEPAKAVGTSYLGMRKERAEKMKKRRRNTYSYMSSRARAMHVKYKAFSLGFVEKSLFDTNGIDSAEYINAQTEAYCRYRDFSKGENVSNREEWRERMHLIAWLEKRRWNAYIRTLGIRGTTAYDAYAKANVSGSYQQLDVGLHPCLLECSTDGIRGVLLDNGTVDEATLFKVEDKAGFDLLDDLSYDLKLKDFNGYDFKQYDYPYGGDTDALERFIAAGTNKGTKKRRREKVKVENTPEQNAAELQSTEPRETYTPVPLDTSDVTLSDDMLQLTERLAQNVHENWSRVRIADGWSYGEQRDDAKKTTPCLVPYDELPDPEKEYDRVTALETLKTITALGYTITRADESNDEPGEKQQEEKVLTLQV